MRSDESGGAERELVAPAARSPELWLPHQEREGALCIGPPGRGKSHVAKALAHLAVQRGYKVFYRLKFEAKSWRLKEAAERVVKRVAVAIMSPSLCCQVREFDWPRVGEVTLAARGKCSSAWKPTPIKRRGRS
jgi:energy-coupling factor transporter ATP-binding protein EcfA2